MDPVTKTTLSWCFFATSLGTVLALLAFGIILIFLPLTAIYFAEELGGKTRREKLQQEQLDYVRYGAPY